MSKRDSDRFTRRQIKRHGSCRDTQWGRFWFGFVCCRPPVHGEPGDGAVTCGVNGKAGKIIREPERHLAESGFGWFGIFWVCRVDRALGWRFALNRNTHFAGLRTGSKHEQKYE